jgi:F-box/LRR-repeat domain protein
MISQANPRFFTNIDKDVLLYYKEDEENPDLTKLDNWFSDNIEDINFISSLEESKSKSKRLFDNTVYASSMINLFSPCVNFSNKEINNIISKININFIKDKYAFTRTFAKLENVTILDLTPWNMEKGSPVEFLNGLFYGDKSLKSIYGISTLVNKKVTSVNSMFAECESLEEIDISNWDTSSVEDFTRLFDGCKSLKKIKGTIDMKSCIKYSGMFGINTSVGCKELRNLKIKNPPNGFFLSGLEKSQYEIIE